MAERQAKATVAGKAALEPQKSKRKVRAKKPTRAQLHGKLVSPTFFSAGEFIEQVNGFGTPVYSQVSSFAGV